LNPIEGANRKSFWNLRPPLHLKDNDVDHNAHNAHNDPNAPNVLNVIEKKVMHALHERPPLIIFRKKEVRSNGIGFN
jgi:hypothetical protein